MQELFANAITLPQAYHLALMLLQRQGDYTECADWDCMQLEASMTMVVENPLEEPMISRLCICGPRELEQYRLEMLDGLLDWSIDAGLEPYTYHDRMVNYGVGIDQVQFVIDELRRNPSSRRAVIVIRDESDIGSADPACLQHIQFLIRGGDLHCKVLFRSNDACKATFMNAFALVMLQKRIADELGVRAGSYTHRANSFHCYEKDIPMLDRYVGTILSGKRPEELAYDYVGNWDELMADERANIMIQNNLLKQQ